MKTNVKIIAGVAIALLAGYFLGAALGYPQLGSDTGKGDISKVSKFRMSTVSPQINAFQEKVMNDSLELKKAAFSLTCLTARMTEFSGLVNIAVDAAAGKAGLEKSLETLKSMQSLSENAAQSGKDAVVVFDEMVSGKAKNAYAFEQASQNLSLAYLMVDRQLKAGKEFVAEVDSYLAGKSSSDEQKLALARDLWVDYCAGNAVLNKDDAELAYWSKQGNVLNPEQFTLALLKANPSCDFLSAISFDSGLMAINAIASDDLSQLQSVQSQLSALCQVLCSVDQSLAANQSNLASRDAASLASQQATLASNQALFGSRDASSLSALQTELLGAVASDFNLLGFLPSSDAAVLSNVPVESIAQLGALCSDSALGLIPLRNAALASRDAAVLAANEATLASRQATLQASQAVLSALSESLLASRNVSTLEQASTILKATQDLSVLGLGAGAEASLGSRIDDIVGLGGTLPPANPKRF